MSAIDSLAPDQLEKYRNFVEITNWQSDPNLALVLLRSANWNVELAVSLHFDGSSGVPSAGDASPATNLAHHNHLVSSSQGSSSSSRSIQGSHSSTSNSLLDDLYRDPNPLQVAPSSINASPTVYTTARGTGFSLIQTILFFPLSLGYKVFNSLFYFLSTLFPFLPRFTGYYPANRTATHSVNKSVDPKDTAARFIRSFEETYGPNGPKFLELGYSQALEQAKKDLKFLIVILQSDEHDLTVQFNKDVLMDPTVVQFLSRPDLLVWIGNVKESEAYQVANALGCTSFPFAELIAPSPRTPTSSALVMSVLVKLQGKTDAVSFVSLLQSKIEAHGPKIMSLVLDRQERESSRQIRQEQDSAYQRSLAADREREQRAAEERRQREEEELQLKLQNEITEKEGRRLEEERLERLELINQWKKWRALKLGPEPDVNSSVKSARISIRLLSGERVIRRFSVNQSVEDIYAFVECYDILKENQSEDISNIQPPKDYEHVYAFQLISPMPRKVVEVNKSKLIEQESTVYPSGSLVVEEDDDDESEEEN